MVFAFLQIVSVGIAIDEKANNGDDFFYKLLEDSGGTIVFLLYTSVVIFMQIMWFVFFLSCLHTYLLMTNQTTHEYLKKV